MSCNLTLGLRLEFGPEPLRIEMVSPSPQPVRCVVSSTIDGFTVTVIGDHMAYTLPDDKTVAVKVSYTDAKGHPAKVDGDVEWSSADEQIVSVTADGSDSTQAQISPVANLGQTQITAKADADLGSGTQEILCTMDVEVVAGSAVVGTITPVGDPQTAT